MNVNFIKSDKELIYKRYSNKYPQEIKSSQNEFAGEELLLSLKFGETFTKYGEYGSPHSKYVYLSEDEERLYWKPLNCGIFEREHFIESKEVIEFSNRSKMCIMALLPQRFSQKTIYQ